MKKIEFKCISDWKKKCICSARQCKRLENMTDEEILDLIKS